MSPAQGRPVPGSVVLVTGAARGLGKSLVEAFLAAGAARVYAGVREPGSLRNGHAADARVVPVVLDVTSDSDATAAAERCADVTVLVNNAGHIAHATFTGAASLNDARMEMEVNYWGPLRLTRAFAPVLAGNGGGAIVNILSIAALAAMARVGAYSASKAAAFSMTECLQADLAPQGTSVIGVFAGPILTSMAQQTQGRHPPELLAASILTGLETGQRWLFPDPTSLAFASRVVGATWSEILSNRHR